METIAKTPQKPKASSSAKIGALSAMLVILLVTVLEFPPPIGFETRPQTNVSVFWLFFSLLILVSEITAIPLVFRRPGLGWKFGMAAGVLNILQVVADQAHLMQPEVAPLAYSALEGVVVTASLVLIYFSWKLRER